MGGSNGCGPPQYLLKPNAIQHTTQGIPNIQDHVCLLVDVGRNPPAPPLYICNISIVTLWYYYESNYVELTYLLCVRGGGTSPRTPLAGMTHSYAGGIPPHPPYMDPELRNCMQNKNSPMDWTCPDLVLSVMHLHPSGACNI